MTQSNPFESPTADSAESTSKFNFASAILAFVVFGVVSFQSFLILLLAFFGQSSAYWPGYLCGGIGILLGLFTAYLTLSTKIVQQVGWASLLAASMSSFLVIIVLMMQTNPERV